MPWLILVQVKGAMAHPVYQVVASVRLKVPWVSHGEQYTIVSVTPPLLLHQSCLTLAPPTATAREVDAATAGVRAASFRTTGLTRTSPGVLVASGTGGSGASLRPLRRARRIATHTSNTAPPTVTAKSMTCRRFEWPLLISSHLSDLTTLPHKSFEDQSCYFFKNWPYFFP